MASSLFSFIFFIVFFLPVFTCAQNSSIVPIGSSLVAREGSNSWLSPSGDFAFGFKKLDDSDQFLLSIWFDKIPNKTIVWYQYDAVPQESTVVIDAQDGLVLRDPQGRRIWSTADIVEGGVSHGAMNDTGNFVILHSDSYPLWESFDIPTDTILPTQKIEVNGTLISRKSEKNFTPGRFYLIMSSNGDLMLNTRNGQNQDYDVDYFNSQTSDPANESNSGSQLIFTERGYLFVIRRNGQQSSLTIHGVILTSWDYYHRATLDFDGVFRQYFHPKNFTGNSRWTTAQYWPTDICRSIDGERGSGACGYNSVCRINNGNPICECPRGFELADRNNPFSDCLPKFLLPSCEDNQTGSPTDIYELLEVPATDWPLNDFAQISPCTVEDCKNSCLNDCVCTVSIHKNNRCWKKRMPLSNGRIDTDLKAKAFLKLRKGDVPAPARNLSHPDKQKKDQRTLTLVVSVLLGSSAFINFMFLGAACMGFFLMYHKKITSPNSVTTHRDADGVNLPCFSYEELAQATEGFKEELGRGSFAIVYKGVMPTVLPTTIAVKKLDRVAQDIEKEFKTEVKVIGQTHHKNLVRLLGYCNEGPHRMLVYEYMNNGTLADFLFGDQKPNWNLRTEIALGVARGLAYLHEECITQIIHCDIKPQNILLDAYYTARISDFGLAKLLMMNQSRTLTSIRGTKGYVAPEWFRNIQVSVKVDVYSFGVLLLEIITCRKSMQAMEFGEEENPILTQWVWDYFEEGRLDTLVKNDTEALNDKTRLERFVMVGIWCIQEDLSLRPTMRKVIQMLEGIIDVSVPPCPYLFTVM